MTRSEVILPPKLRPLLPEAFFSDFKDYNGKCEFAQHCLGIFFDPYILLIEMITTPNKDPKVCISLAEISFSAINRITLLLIHY